MAFMHDRGAIENSTAILLKTMRGDDYKSIDIP
jgi:hypothetical protein